MAIITKGITGGFSGKCGHLSGYTLKSKSIIKSNNLINKNKSKKPLRQNGANLIELTKYYPFMAPPMQQLLDKNNLGINVNWNQIVSSVLGNCSTGKQGYYTPILLGHNQTPSNLKFLCRVSAHPADLRISFDMVNSLRQSFGNVYINTAVADSTGVLSNRIKNAITFNNSVADASGASPVPNYWRLLICWFSNADDSLRSQVSFAFNAQF